jgi:hypothetical protein
MLLSVHSKCSRLAVLGELGHYPTLKYQYTIISDIKWDPINSGKLLVYERGMLGDHRKHKENFKKNNFQPQI